MVQAHHDTEWAERDLRRLEGEVFTLRRDVERMEDFESSGVWESSSDAATAQVVAGEDQAGDGLATIVEEPTSDEVMSKAHNCAGNPFWIECHEKWKRGQESTAE